MADALSVTMTATRAGLAVDRLKADASILARAYLGTERNGIDHRFRTGVWIHGLDRCGLAAAFALIAAGIGAIESDDNVLVSPADLGTSPLRMTELGLPRPVALDRHARRLYPHASVSSGTDLAAALPRVGGALAVGWQALPADLAAALANATVPALPVLLTEDGFRIGPMILPDAPGCHRCRVEAWSVTDTDTPMATSGETTSSLIAAGIAAQSLLLAIDAVLLPSVAFGTLVGTLGAAAIHFEELPATCAHETQQDCVGSLPPLPAQR